jgi:hypothetical protein
MAEEEAELLIQYPTLEDITPAAPGSTEREQPPPPYSAGFNPEGRDIPPPPYSAGGGRAPPSYSAEMNPESEPQEEELDFEVLKKMFPDTHIGVKRAVESGSEPEVVGAELKKANEEYAKQEMAKMKKEVGDDSPYEKPDEELFTEEIEELTPDGNVRARTIVHAHDNEGNEEDLFFGDELVSKCHHLDLGAPHNPLATLNHRKYDYQTDEEFAKIEDFMQNYNPHPLPANVVAVVRLEPAPAATTEAVVTTTTEVM